MNCPTDRDVVENAHLPRNILLVEDNPGDAILLKEAFDSVGVTREVVVAADGENALETLNKQFESVHETITELVLLDLNLPGLDGKEVLGAIRNDEKLRDLPVIILSSSGAPDDVTEAYKLRANAYVVKPTEMSGYLHMAESLSRFWLDLAVLPT